MQKQKNSIDKYRSYSKLFSSAKFNKLLKKEDISFLTSNISAYDKQVFESAEFHSYMYYVKYVYNELVKYYRNEYIFKNSLINQLLLKKYGLENTTAINEFRVGKSIADLALFNGNSKVFEVKTGLDNDSRLNNQLRDYYNVFNECYIVTEKSQIDKYAWENCGTGLILLKDDHNGISLKKVRDAKINENLDNEVIMRSLRTDEYKKIVFQYYGYLPKMNSFNMYDICKELIMEIPTDELSKLFVQQMKMRKSAYSYIDQVDSELRQLVLSMNLPFSKYEKMKTLLNKTLTA
jgi:hypothetical protein